MRPLLTLLLLLTLSLPLSAADAPPLTPTQISRLESLCRLWGTVKFFHPWIVAPPDGKLIDWDAALVETIPLVEKATTADEFRAAINHLLSKLNDPATRAVSSASNSPQQKPVEPGLPGVRFAEQGGKKILIIDATNWRSLAADPTKSSGGLFTAAFAHASDSEAIVIDLRRQDASVQIADDPSAAPIESALAADIATLLKSNLKLAALRSRYHSGYPPEQANSYTSYRSGFLTADHPVLQARSGPAAGKRFIILTSATAPIAHALLAALQSSGQALILRDRAGGDDLPPASTYSVTLVDDSVARIRTGDYVHPDGTIGLVPELIGQQATADAPDPLLKSALALASGEDEPPRRQQRQRAPVHRDLSEKPYLSGQAPSRELRLLGLFRVWNVMHYFFAYHELMDRSWDSVLTEFIPRFAQVTDPVEYGLLAMELVAHLQDSHVTADRGLASRALVQLLAVQPLILLRPIREEFAVVAADSSLKEQVQVGDVVLSVDGEPLTARANRLKKYFSASTPQALRGALCDFLLGGNAGTDALLTLRSPAGATREVSVPRPTGPAASAGWQELWKAQARTTPVFSVLPAGFGYCDLTRLKPDQVDGAFAAVKDKPALIFDLRGYPQGTAPEVMQRFIDKPTKTAAFRRPYWTSPDPAQNPGQKIDQIFPATDGEKYRGRVVVLIDDRAVSQSEHFCLLFEEAAKGRITFLGTPTTGANGTVSNTSMPGGIRIYFTGLDTRHADGRQLQRLGIQPDLRVEPTPSGLAANQDELLAAAIKFLNDSK
jgi:C-terminal processing protease CtpA/Prc